MPLPDAGPATPVVDSHCHLDFPDFDGERDALIDRARAAGVTRMVTICTRLRNEPSVRAIAEAHPGLVDAAAIPALAAHAAGLEALPVFAEISQPFVAPA